MSTVPRNEKCSKRRRTTEDESLFTDVAIPLSSPNLLRMIQPCELPSEELGVQQEAAFHTGYTSQSTSPLTASETIGHHADNSEFQSEDFGYEPSQPRYPIDFLDNYEQELDSMWNDVCETLIAESNERELWEWGSAEEEDGQFEEIVEHMTLSQTFDTLSHEVTSLDSGKESPAPSNTKSSSEQEKLYPRAKVTIGAVMVLFTLYAIKYDLTGEAITHLLQFISLLLLSGNILPDTLRKFKIFFNKLDGPVILYDKSAYCLSYIDKKAATCPNTACMKGVSSQHAKVYFIEIPAVYQLSDFFLKMVSLVTYNIVFTEPRSIPKTWRKFTTAHFTRNIILRKGRIVIVP